MNKEQSIKGNDEMTNKKLFDMAEKCFSELPPGVQAITNHNSFIQGYCASYAENVHFPTPVQSGEERLLVEIERLKGLIGEAWRQAIRNCAIKKGAYESDERYVYFRDFQEQNNL